MRKRREGPTVEQRRAFRPDLREAALEDRTLLAGPAGIYPSLINPNGNFAYFSVWGFQNPVGGNTGSSGPQALRQSSTGGVPVLSASTLGFVLIGGNYPGYIAGLGTPTTGGVGPSNSGGGRVVSGGGGQLLALASSVSGGSNGDHNTGPVSSSSNMFGGYGTSFSSGGNFASSFSGTYNGFSNSLDFPSSGGTPANAGASNGPAAADESRDPSLGSSSSPSYTASTPNPVAGVPDGLTYYDMIRRLGAGGIQLYTRDQVPGSMGGASSGSR